MRNRTLFFLIALLAGMILAILGIALSAPIGPPDSPGISNPKVDFAPLMFVLGITLMFGSAVVYELVPDKWDQ
ncbi:MAG: hypothetical protein V3S20_08000 [Dehalococcoidia bacterium]